MYDDRGHDARGYDDRGWDDERDRYHRAPPPPDGHRRGPPPPPRGDEYRPTRISYKCLAGMVVAIVAVILIFIFMSYPWYNVSYSEKPENEPFQREFLMDYKLEKVTYELKAGNYSFKDSVSYDDAENNGTMDEVKEIMDYTYLFYMIAVIMLVLAIVLIPIVAIGKLPHAAGTVFLILALLFVMLIPIYFYFSLPPAIETQFDQQGLNESVGSGGEFKYNGQFLSSGKGTFYTQDNNEDIRHDYNLEWGPGMGYWFTLVMLIIIVVAQVVYSSGRHDLPGKQPQGGYERERPPPPPRRRGRDHDYYDDGRPPPPRRGGRGYDPYEYDERPPPPRQRRDYGPPRPMRDDDYQEVGISQRPRPPRPPRRRDGY